MKTKEKTIYRVKGLHKLSEEVIYSQGCVVGTARAFYIEETFEAETMEDLLKTLMSFVGLDINDSKDRAAVSLNACNEPGRIDMCLLESQQGWRFYAPQIEEWKRGERRAWLCDYIAHVTQHIVREAQIPSLAGFNDAMA